MFVLIMWLEGNGIIQNGHMNTGFIKHIHNLVKQSTRFSWFNKLNSKKTVWTRLMLIQYISKLLMSDVPPEVHPVWTRLKSIHWVSWLLTLLYNIVLNELVACMWDITALRKMAMFWLVTCLEAALDQFKRCREYGDLLFVENAQSWLHYY